MCGLLLQMYLHLNDFPMQGHILKTVAEQKSIYDLVQTSESARQWAEFTRKEFPGDFTASLDLTPIYDGRAVFEPNPSQQGLKLEFKEADGDVKASL